MTDNWFRIILLGSIMLLLAACGQIDANKLPNETFSPPTATQSDADTQIETQKDITQMTQPAPLQSATGLEGLIEEARDHLAQQLSISGTEIVLVDAREVTWPDAGLGCPQPGMKYIQVPEDGALIILQAQGTSYEYHSGGKRGLFLCEKSFSIPEKPTQIDITNLTPRPLDKNAPPPSTPDQGILPGEDQ